MSAQEINFDGLIGPTHNYSGLAFGNVASATNAGGASSPRQAARQGLEKMRFLMRLGIPQAVLPPHARPHFAALHQLGFIGSEPQIIEKAYKQAPSILANCYSASAMWAANAATISPSTDTQDGKVHFTPANLVSTFHRSLEADFTSRLLKTIFADEKYFVHHAPLPATPNFADEGAANHMRLTPQHGAAGLECFVYGRTGDQAATRTYPARQSRMSAETILRTHGLQEKQSILLQQHPEAIDAGVFHNDVIATTNENVLFCHERAFQDPNALMVLQKAADFPLCMIVVKENEVPLTLAVKSYLFNSQLVSLPEGGMAFIAPTECEENATVHAYLQALVKSNANPLNALYILNVRESMKNGGGPACLRLRVVLTGQEKKAVHPGVMLTDSLYTQLVGWIDKHYRETLKPADLADPRLAEESRHALDALTALLGLGSLYDFQR